MQKITFVDSNGTVEVELNDFDCVFTCGNFKFTVVDDQAEVAVYDSNSGEWVTRVGTQYP